LYSFFSCLGPGFCLLHPLFVCPQGISRSNPKEDVAIKIVSLEDGEDDVAVIHREVQALSVTGVGSRLSVPQLVSYHGSEMHGSKLWIAMDYADGGSFADLLKLLPGARMQEHHIAIVAREVLLALAHLHKAGQVHRDIKSANILVKKDGTSSL
jgi:serine/threonine protein kinase